jgi:hypothetical protein|tara:strand:- start:758 stop:934 length:177 start_codon:yes stop_codon:yes gene_type:complete
MQETITVEGAFLLLFFMTTIVTSVGWITAHDWKRSYMEKSDECAKLRAENSHMKWRLK